MNYKINTTMEVIKEVFAITKSLGLDFLLIGADKDIDIDIKKIAFEIFETNMTNRFCQLVTGDRETNFDQLPFLTQEEVILSFFTDIQRLSKESQIIRMLLGNLKKTEIHSLTSVVSSDKTESTQTT